MYLQNSFIVIPAIDNPAATQWLLRGATVDLEAGTQVLQAFLDPGLRRGDGLVEFCKRLMIIPQSLLGQIRPEKLFDS